LRGKKSCLTCFALMKIEPLLLTSAQCTKVLWRGKSRNFVHSVGLLPDEIRALREPYVPHPALGFS
jgi:hypothetical protein